jgi:hypothetical protein
MNVETYISFARANCTVMVKKEQKRGKLFSKDFATNSKMIGCEGGIINTCTVCMMAISKAFETNSKMIGCEGDIFNTCTVCMMAISSNFPFRARFNTIKPKCTALFVTGASDSETRAVDVGLLANISSSDAEKEFCTSDETDEWNKTCFAHDSKLACATNAHISMALGRAAHTTMEKDGCSRQCDKP